MIRPMRPALVSSVFLLACFVYAALRYLVFGDVAVDQLPVFVMNKALSMAGLVLIALAVGARPIVRALPALGWLKADRRALGMAGLGFAGVHTALSLMLLNPAYFGKIYSAAAGRMSLWAELSMLAGAVALALLVWQSRITGNGKTGDDAARRASTHRRWLGTGVLALTLLHVAFMGWPGWLAPGDWPGGMPPITLLSAGVALVGVALGLAPRRG